MSLSDAALRNAKPRDTDYQLRDGAGLYVLVKTDGAMFWRQDFKFAGKRRTTGLGRYPQVGLAAARKERDRVKELVAKGIDPVQERRTGAGEADATFKSIALQWFKANRPDWNDRTYNAKKQRFDDHIFPHIGHRDIRTISPTEFLNVIRKLEERDATDLPRRLRGDCGRVFRFAIAHGWETRDVTADIKDALKKRPPTEHRAFIRPAEMGSFLVKLHEAKDEEDDTKDAMLLTILTALRTDEIRFAARSEFEDLDGDRPQWRIPKERMKQPREHIVPLSTQATAIVRRRIEKMRPGRQLLFYRPTRSGSISENTMLYALYRLGYHSRATMHGFRRTFSTLANEATKELEGDEVPMWHHDWIERCLAHVPEDKVRAAYNAAEYLPQRRRLLQWWADWLDNELEMARLIG